MCIPGQDESMVTSCNFRRVSRLQDTNFDQILEGSHYANSRLVSQSLVEDAGRDK